MQQYYMPEQFSQIEGVEEMMIYYKNSSYNNNIYITNLKEDSSL